MADAQALIVGQLDIKIEEAKRRVLELMTELESKPIKLRVDVDRSQSRTTFGGQVVEGADVEGANGPATPRGPTLDPQVELQRRFYQLPGSSLSQSGFGGGRPLVVDAINRVLGQQGQVVPVQFGSIQALPGTVSIGAAEAGVRNPAQLTAALQATNARLSRLPTVNPNARQPGETAEDFTRFQQAQQEDARRLRYNLYQRAADREGVVGPRLSDAQFDSPSGRLQAGEDFRANRDAVRGEVVARQSAESERQRAEREQARAASEAVRQASRDRITAARAAVSIRRFSESADANAASYGVYETRLQESGFIGPAVSPDVFAGRAGRSRANEELRQSRTAQTGEQAQTRVDAAAAQREQRERTTAERRAQQEQQRAQRAAERAEQLAQRQAATQARADAAEVRRVESSDQRTRLQQARYSAYEQDFRATGAAGPLLSPDRLGTSEGAFTASRDLANLRRLAPRPAEERLTLAQQGREALRGALRGIAIPLFAERASIGVLQATNEAEEAQIAAGGDRFALARASIENNVARNFVSGVPLFGNAAVQLGEAFTGSTAGANRILQSAQFQDQATAATRQRAESIVAGRNALAVSQAGLAGSSAADIRAIANNTATAEQRRQATIEGAEKERERVNVANANVARLHAALPGAIDGDGRSTERVTYFDAEGTRRSRPIEFDKKGRAVTSIEGASSILPRDFDRLKDFNAAIDEQTSARGALARVGTDASRLRDLSNAGDAAQLQRIVQAAADTTAQSTTRTLLGGQSFALARSGFRLESERAGVAAQFDPQIDQGNRDIERLRGTNREGLNADAIAALDAALAERVQAVAELVQQKAINTTAVQVAERQLQIGVAGTLAASQARLNFDPFGARRAENEAQYRQAVSGLDLSNPLASLSPVAIAAAVNFGTTQREIDQQQSVTRLGANVGIATERRQINSLLARDPYGAEAQGIAGNAIGAAVSLFTNNQDGAARELLNNAQGRELLASRQFAEGFRGEQYDVFNDASIFDSRNTIDVGASFDKYQNAIDSIGRVAGAPDDKFLDAAGKESGADMLSGIGGDVAAIKEFIAAWNQGNQ